jgi:hypothetical protein
VQHWSERAVVGYPDISKSLVETNNRTAIHLCVFPIAAMYLDDGGLVPIRIGIHAGATECLSPVSGESLDMLGMEAVAERVADDFVGHHPTMPALGKTPHAVHSTRRFEDALHALYNDNRPVFLQMAVVQHEFPQAWHRALLCGKLWAWRRNKSS